MEIRAVGVTPVGKLFGIRSADSVRGMRFLRIIVAVDQEKWWLENKDVLVECIDGVEGGAIDLLFDVEEEG